MYLLDASAVKNVSYSLLLLSDTFIDLIDRFPFLLHGYSCFCGGLVRKIFFFFLMEILDGGDKLHLALEF